MRQETCDACGAQWGGGDKAELVQAGLDHFTSVHPEWGLNRISIENYIDAKDRITGATERLEKIHHVEVVEVTTERIEDALDFFDRDGFADNPGWASCYCMFYHRDDPQSNGSMAWKKNRDDLRKRLEDGTTLAYLAYVDGKPGGWCNASPRAAYPVRRTGVADESTGVVACFVIAPPYRRHGLSRMLLNAAIEGFRSRGINLVEAHPLVESVDDAPNYHGPMSLYLEAGFVVAEQDEKKARVTIQL